MVTITIFVEGGTLEHQNINVPTVNNSQRLRESFHTLLSQRINPEKFRLVVEIGGPNKNTIKFFKSELEKGKEALLLIDLDMPKEKRSEQLGNFDLHQAKFSQKTFFMIQELEAWILSQPEIIEKCFEHKIKHKRVKPEVELKNDSGIKDKNPEEIVKPSIVLKTLIGRYFKEEKRGKKQKKKYGKLRDAPDLIELLELTKLENTFSDVKNLVKNISLHN